MVVQCAAFLLSVAWGLVTFLTAWLVWRHQSGNSGQQASHCLPALVACTRATIELEQTLLQAARQALSLPRVAI